MMFLLLMRLRRPSKGDSDIGHETIERS